MQKHGFEHIFDGGDMAADTDHTLKNSDGSPAKKAWKAMTLVYVGEAKDVVKGGGGKLSPTTGDTGDVRKPPGHG
jgi:hypothetical protein